MLILSLVAAASVGAFTGRRRQLEQARSVTLAHQALANEAEFRRRIPFDQLEGAPTGFISDTELLRPLAPFAATTRVEPVRPGLRNVVMTVRWGKGKAELVVVRADTGGGTFW